MISSISQASLKTELLMDFNCYIDTEIGLIRLIQNKYLDSRVFNKKILFSGSKYLLSALIERKEFNPLYIIANDNISREDLDDYYKEFMETEYESILNYSYITEVENFINLLKTEPAIHITFLCNSELEANLIKNLKSLNVKYNIIFKNDNNDKSNYSTYYFKYVTDDLLDYIFPFKNYYFSKYKLNFNDELDFEKRNYIDVINKMGGEVRIMDLYNRVYLVTGEE